MVSVPVVVDVSGIVKDLQLKPRQKTKCEMASDPSHEVHRPKHIIQST